MIKEKHSNTFRIRWGILKKKKRWNTFYCLTKEFLSIFFKKNIFLFSHWGMRMKLNFKITNFPNLFYFWNCFLCQVKKKIFSFETFSPGLSLFILKNLWNFQRFEKSATFYLIVWIFVYIYLHCAKSYHMSMQSLRRIVCAWMCMCGCAYMNENTHISSNGWMFEKKQNVAST